MEAKMVEAFKNREVFSREELFRFFKQQEPELKDGTFGWRLYELKRKHLIKDVRKGVYTLEQKQHFLPQPDETIHQIVNFLSNSFIHHFYNIWNTAWLNEMIELQATSFLYILEVDKDSMQTVFYSLKDKTGLSNLFLKPDEKVIETYVSELTKAIIVEPMITRAPVVRAQNITFPTLEKILVDLYCDDKLFFAYQGTQLIKIYETCLDKYFINFSRLFNYARRRKREESLKSFFLEHQTLNEKIKDMLE